MQDLKVSVNYIFGVAQCCDGRVYNAECIKKEKSVTVRRNDKKEVCAVHPYPVCCHE